MSKEKSFIFTKEFDKAVSDVRKKDYSEIQENLKKLAEKSLEFLKETKRT
ncbi:hypothetical protein ACJDU8_23700 [Clostridium sp. WILCCON 0269]|uniref:Uncharacterized protein n=1 Tax=Candidatus Clostridium eludens TaxID=3381663 RepID=A0ABW8SR50_9CLOT